MTDVVDESDRAMRLVVWICATLALAAVLAYPMCACATFPRGPSTPCAVERDDR